MVPVERRGTFLGIQSAVGFSMTVIAPVIFGHVLFSFNGTLDPTSAVVWGPAFAILGLGAIAAPVLAVLMRKLPQAKLMAGGKM
jgi:MFS family permease